MSIRKVLIVENNPLCQEALKALFSHYPCKVNIASTATEAFNDVIQKADYWVTDGYDLIFTNVYLPDIDGCSLIDILGKIVKLIKEKTYIVMIKANKGFIKRVDVCYDLKEVDEIISKPITLKEIDIIWKNSLKRLTEKHGCNFVL